MIRFREPKSKGENSSERTVYTKDDSERLLEKKTTVKGYGRKDESESDARYRQGDEICPPHTAPLLKIGYESVQPTVAQPG